jgi:lipopolysaccharide transport protein LptA
VGKDESTIELDGNVKVEASDGLVLTTQRALYTQLDGLTRIPGEATFSRGRMNGSGLGMTFDQKENILVILDQARVHVAAGEDGLSATDMAAGTLEFKRRERVMRFDRQMTATRGRQNIAADIAVAHLTEDEQRLEAMELRGNSSIRETAPAANGLEGLTGQDIDLRYGPDGQTIQHALINGNAAIRIAGDRRQPARQIGASAIDITLAPNGATVQELTARQDVRVDMPADSNGVTRLINADQLIASGDEQRGLTSARFDGTVEFAEKSATMDRAAQARALDLAVAPGFSGINDARFAGRVRFVDGPLFATAALARYMIEGGTLALSGSEPGSLAPHLINQQIAVDAAAVDVLLEGPVLKATGAVKSVLQAKKPDAKPTDDDLKMPSMLKQDQPVNVTADALDYQGDQSRAVYTGAALLWQGETQIKAPSIIIDSKKGDLDTKGPVATVAMFSQEGKDGKTEHIRTVGSAGRFQYEDAQRRAVYTGDAHLRGPQGDLTADRIELFLQEQGDELQRVEGFDKVTLRSEGRRTTGTRLTYFGNDGRYIVTGAPVKAVDECGRETVGRTLTFFRSTDRMIVDGNEQARTQTTGKPTANCQGTPVP